jgi:hypothetical protein
MSRTSFSSKAFEERMRKIDNAIDEEDWFSAFALVGSYFEHYSYWAVRFYCNKAKINLTQKAVESLKRSGSAELLLSLLLLKLIDENTYSKMKKIIEERNKVVHPLKESIRYADEKQKDEAVRLLKEAKDCLLQVRRSIKL